MQRDLENDLLVLLYDVARQMRTVTDQLARKHRSTRPQFMVLARLERRPGMSQNELAAISEVAPITVARLIDRLEAQGLVERCADPKDRRIWRLRLTPAAAPILRDVKRWRTEVRALMTKGGESGGFDSDSGRLAQHEGEPEPQPRRSAVKAARSLRARVCAGFSNAA